MSIDHLLACDPAEQVDLVVVHSQKEAAAIASLQHDRSDHGGQSRVPLSFHSLWWREKAESLLEVH